jgi:hypothetical protein
MAFKYKGLRLKDPSLMKKLRQVPLTFTRASVAYDYKGDAVGVNTPRFQHLINGVMEYGCLIEEAHTNILPASQSQSLSEAYTTAALNGTYTFQCEGTGSYELSGGATGTVSKDNPVTAAVSSATVTLTPTGTSTLNQILNKAYPLSYTLGGTTQAAETLNPPTSYLGLTQGTIECTVIVTPALKTNTAGTYYFLVSTGTINDKIQLYKTAGKWAATTRGTSTSTISANDTVRVNTTHNIEMTYGVDLSLYLDGDSIITPLSSPNLPTATAPIYIGSRDADYQCNGIIKNVTFSAVNYSPSMIKSRANLSILSKGFTINKETKFVAPLTQDLKAYRVRT